jgi:signal transduction histidine kinase
MEYNDHMNRYLFAIHDLNNKLMLLYGYIRKLQQGNPPSHEKIDALIERINEMMKSLYSDYQPDFIHTPQLEALSREEILKLVDSLKEKSAKIFPDIDIKTQITNVHLNHEAKIEVERELLYQVIENAIENSRNANATEVQMNLSFELDSVVIELCDNGNGFKTHKKLERLIPQATGMMIIQGNMQSMGARLKYLENKSAGVTLQLIFPINPQTTPL